MSLQSYKSKLIGEVRSGQIDPGEEARLRGAIQFVEAEESADERIPKIPAPVIIPLPVEFTPVEEIIDLDDPIPEEPADPSAAA